MNSRLVVAGDGVVVDIAVGAVHESDTAIVGNKRAIGDFATGGIRDANAAAIGGVGCPGGRGRLRGRRAGIGYTAVAVELEGAIEHVHIAVGRQDPVITKADRHFFKGNAGSRCVNRKHVVTAGIRKMDESRGLKRATDSQGLIDCDSLSNEIEARVQEDAITRSGRIDSCLDCIVSSASRQVCNSCFGFRV